MLFVDFVFLPLFFLHFQFRRHRTYCFYDQQEYSLFLRIFFSWIQYFDDFLLAIDSKYKRALSISLSRSLIFPPILIFILTVIFGGEVVWFCHSLSEEMSAFIVFGILLCDKKNAKNKLFISTDG